MTAGLVFAGWLRQIRALRDRIGEMKETHEAHMEAILDKYASLRRQVTRYHTAIEHAMAATET